VALPSESTVHIERQRTPTYVVQGLDLSPEGLQSGVSKNLYLEVLLELRFSRCLTTSPTTFRCDCALDVEIYVVFLLD
jgi:hypothetical protein